MHPLATSIARPLLLVAACVALVAIPLRPAHAATRGDHAPVILDASLGHVSRPITRVDTMTAYARAWDAERDPLVMRYRWYDDGRRLSATGRTIALSRYAVHHGDRVWASIAAWDGRKLSPWRATAHVTIADAPPSVSSLHLPSSAVAGDVLSPSFAVSDIDSDPLVITHAWSWTCPELPPGAWVGDDLDLAARSIVHGCRVSVFVTVSDGTRSASAAAGPLVISDTAPVVTSSSLAPGLATVQDTLTVTADASDADGEPFSFAYRWLVNGEPVPGQSGSQLVLAGVAARGDDVTAEVRAYDGSQWSDWAATDPVTVSDSPPTITDASIDYDATAGNATASAVGSDPDGDALVTEVEWYLNGSDAGAGTSIDVASTGAIAGDTLEAWVRVSDGHGRSSDWLDRSVTVADIAPVISSVGLSSSSPAPGDTISASPVTSDADGDSLRTTVEWFVDGREAGTGSQFTVPAEAVKGTTVRADVTVSDGALTAVASDTAVVGDSAPVITGAGIDPGSGGTDATLTALGTASDHDGDSTTLTYAWHVNGFDVGSGPTLDLSQAGNGDKGDTVTLVVTADDGELSSDSAPQTYVIANSAPSLDDASISYDPDTGTATASATGTDPDGDTLTPEVQWSLKGGSVGNAASISLAEAGAWVGDTLTAKIRLGDGDGGLTDWVTRSITPATGPVTRVNAPTVPFAITSASIGSTVSIHTDNSSPTNGVVSAPHLVDGGCVSGGGANDYANQISGAETICPLVNGTFLPVKTGQNTGPTAQGLNARITVWRTADAIVGQSAGGWTAIDPASVQLVRIPQVTDSNGMAVWPLGAANVRVVGMYWAVILSCGSLAAPSYCLSTDGKLVNVLIVGQAQ